MCLVRCGTLEELTYELIVNDSQYKNRYFEGGTSCHSSFIIPKTNHSLRDKLCVRKIVPVIQTQMGTMPAPYETAKAYEAEYKSRTLYIVYVKNSASKDGIQNSSCLFKPKSQSTTSRIRLGNCGNRGQAVSFSQAIKATKISTLQI